jgi:hypothetical protein
MFSSSTYIRIGEAGGEIIRPEGRENNSRLEEMITHLGVS